MLSFENKSTKSGPEQSCERNNPYSREGQFTFKYTLPIKDELEVAKSLTSLQPNLKPNENKSMQTVCQFPLHIESPPSFEPKQMASRLSDETDKEALIQLQEEEEDEE